MNENEQAEIAAEPANEAPVESNVITEPVVDEVKSTTQKRDFVFRVGDTVIVSNRIQEEGKSRIQKFEGIVIAMKGAGQSKTFTVRKLGVNDIGVERIFPWFSPNVADVEIKKSARVRRAKLYFLRSLRGKKATTLRSR